MRIPMFDACKTMKSNETNDGEEYNGEKRDDENTRSRDSSLTVSSENVVDWNSPEMMTEPVSAKVTNGQTDTNGASTTDNAVIDATTTIDAIAALAVSTADANAVKSSDKNSEENIRREIAVVDHRRDHLHRRHHRHRHLHRLRAPRHARHQPRRRNLRTKTSAIPGSVRPSDATRLVAKTLAVKMIAMRRKDPNARLDRNP